MTSILVTLILTMTGTEALDTESKSITIGKPFPVFPAHTLKEDDLTDITRFRGKKLFLHVFAAW